MSEYLAPAKINLHLAITAVRDDGYHELDTSFVFIDVFDVLHISPADELKVTCSEQSLSGEKNLVYKLLQAFREKYGVTSGMDVHIEKKLPAEAGLGGGSSDAATALMVANDLWQVGLSRDELIAYAAPFGADIPCFLFARASHAFGVGEKLEGYNGLIPKGFIVIAWPGMGVSTAQAFRHYDENKFHALTSENSAATVRARSAEKGFELGYNDLEESALALCHPLEAMLMEMRKKAELAWMSGSGSACVAVCDTKHQATELAQDLQMHKLASWVHVGHIVTTHPLKEIGV